MTTRDRILKFVIFLSLAVIFLSRLSFCVSLCLSILFLSQLSFVLSCPVDFIILTVFRPLILTYTFVPPWLKTRGGEILNSVSVTNKGDATTSTIRAGGRRVQCVKFTQAPTRKRAPKAPNSD
jgi:hypothetical protein